MKASRICSRRRVAAMALVAVLAGCGGDGGGDAPASTAGTLFLSDPATGEVAVYPTLAPAAGASFEGNVAATAPTLSFDAPHQSLSAQPMAYDAAHDELYVGGMGAATDPYPGFGAVRVFSNASKMSAGATPSRVIWTEKVLPIRQLFHDAATDSLTISGAGTLGVGAEIITEMHRFAHASTASGLDPEELPIAQQGFRSAGMNSMVAMDDVRDVFYVSDLYADFVGTVSPGIAVFTNASSAPDTPSRMIAGATRAYAIALDGPRDTLYVTDPQGLWILQHASTAAPTTIGPIAMSSAFSVAVDERNDRLYVGADQKLYVFEHASALTARSTLPTPSVVDAAGAGSAIFGIAFR